MTTGIRLSIEGVFVSDGDGLARSNDSRQEQLVSKYKFLYHFNEILIRYDR